MPPGQTPCCARRVCGSGGPPTVGSLSLYGFIRAVHDAHQEQAVRWRHGPSVLTLTSVQNRRHGVSSDLPAPNSHECADNVACHVLQKAISTEHKDQARRVPGDPQAEELAPRAARPAGRCPEGRKIVLPHEDAGRRAHSGQIECLRHVPGIGGTQGRGDGVIVHHVGVGLASGSVAGMKIGRHLCGLVHHNIIGEEAICPGRGFIQNIQGFSGISRSAQLR